MNQAAWRVQGRCERLCVGDGGVTANLGHFALRTVASVDTACFARPGARKPLFVPERTTCDEASVAIPEAGSVPQRPKRANQGCVLTLAPVCSPSEPQAGTVCGVAGRGQPQRARRVCNGPSTSPLPRATVDATNVPHDGNLDRALCPAPAGYAALSVPGFCCALGPRRKTGHRGANLPLYGSMRTACVCCRNA